MLNMHRMFKAVLISSVLYVVFSPLPDYYVSLPAVDKQTILWNNIFSSKFTPPYPAVDFDPNITSPLVANPNYTQKAFTIESDEFPRDRNKVIHHFGTVAKVLFSLLPSSPYTGIFKGTSENIGLVRLSLLNLDMSNIIPGFVMKIFVSGQPSLNIFAQDDFTGLAGQGINRNFFLHNFSNWIPIPDTLDDMTKRLVDSSRIAVQTLPGGNGSCLQPLDENKLPLLMHSLVEQNGNNVLYPYASLILTLVPNPDNAIAPNDQTDFRELMARIPNGRLLFAVYSRPSENATNKLIGQITVETQFVASDYGDNHLLFQHPYKRC